MSPLTVKRVNILRTVFLSVFTVVCLYALYKFVDAPLRNFQTKAGGQTAAVIAGVRAGLRAAFVGIPALILLLPILSRLSDDLGAILARREQKAPASLRGKSSRRLDAGSLGKTTRPVRLEQARPVMAASTTKGTDRVNVGRETLIRSTYNAALRLEDPQRKGKALEELLAAIIASIDGFIEHGRNVYTETEEVDIIFRNESRDDFWRKFGALILVECKNWKSQRVGKNEFIQFQAKMGDRAGLAKLGFLVSTGAFTETVTKEMLRSSRGDVLVVPVDGSRLAKLIECSNRSELLKQYTTQASLI